MPPKKEPADAIKLSLIENGLDFIRAGLKSITANESKFDLKYAVLHISAGIELVLKDRKLARIVLNTWVKSYHPQGDGPPICLLVSAW